MTKKQASLRIVIDIMHCIKNRNSVGLNQNDNICDLSGMCRLKMTIKGLLSLFFPSHVATLLQRVTIL
jgi:hypothetical protein